ncbi:MAG TPA: TraR/DksA family transcriptional regulator [Kofleriaceae bacterium]|jgi:DnaK suppressor protein|nr:TraR/DksA family transcriptional regulator [Kofleriaceae bacterium]
MTKTHLSPDDLVRLRQLLVRRRDELAATISDNDPAQRQTTDEPEAGDMAEQIIEQDDALRAVAFDKPLLADVEHALAKLDAGTYGLSEVSGEPIPLDRLLAVPWARRTLREEAAARK